MKDAKVKDRPVIYIYFVKSAERQYKYIEMSKEIHFFISFVILNTLNNLQFSLNSGHAIQTTKSKQIPTPKINQEEDESIVSILLPLLFYAFNPK